MTRRVLVVLDRATRSKAEMIPPSIREDDPFKLSVDDWSRVAVDQMFKAAERAVAQDDH